eukprot:EG_transcript_21466
MSAAATPILTPVTFQFVDLDPLAHPLPPPQGPRWGRYAAAALGAACVLLLGTAVGKGPALTQRYTPGPFIASTPAHIHVPAVAEPPRRWKPHFRMDPDDIIDVQAEVVDLTEDKAKKGGSPNKGKQGKAGTSQARQVIYEETVYQETRVPPGGNPFFGGMFDNERTAGTMFDYQQSSEPPWWLPIIPIAPYLILGLVAIVAIGCLVSGAFTWVLYFLGCLVVVNTVLGFFIKDDDDDDFQYPPGRGGGSARGRSPWG